MWGAPIKFQRDFQSTTTVMAAKVFHFSKETPPDSMFSDIQALNKFKDEDHLLFAEGLGGLFHKQFLQLLEYVFSFLAESSKSTRLMSQLEDFATNHGVSVGPLKNVFKSLLAVPNSALKKSLGPSQVKEDFLNLGLSEEKSELFAQQWKSNFLALSRSAISQMLMVNQLVDMEWKFGVTAASSELDKVGNTFLQLKLVINTGNGTSNIYMELTLPQFYSFLHEMEKAKASLEYLS